MPDSGSVAPLTRLLPQPSPHPPRLRCMRPLPRPALAGRETAAAAGSAGRGTRRGSSWRGCSSRGCPPAAPPSPFPRPVHTPLLGRPAPAPAYPRPCSRIHVLACARVAAHWRVAVFNRGSAPQAVPLRRRRLSIASRARISALSCTAAPRKPSLFHHPAPPMCACACACARACTLLCLCVRACKCARAWASEPAAIRWAGSKLAPALPGAR